MGAALPHALPWQGAAAAPNQAKAAKGMPPEAEQCLLGFFALQDMLSREDARMLAKQARMEALSCDSGAFFSLPYSLHFRAPAGGVCKPAHQQSIHVRSEVPCSLSVQVRVPALVMLGAGGLIRTAACADGLQ